MKPMNRLNRLNKALILQLWRQSQQAVDGGFTLAELLVASIVGSLIVVGLLGISVDLIRRDQEEAIRTETQRDMQRALDFMISELRDAVYVYPGGETPSTNVAAECNNEDSTSCPPYIKYVGLPTDTTPVLAFWKNDPVDESILSGLNCSAASSTVKQQDCERLLQTRNFFSLVIYTQEVGGGSFKGKTVIRRYFLPKYSNTDLRNLQENADITTGYIDPSLFSSTFFATWPLLPPTGDLDGATNPDWSGQNPVLVDFVDAAVNPDITDVPDCPAVDINSDGDTLDSEDIRYTRSPKSETNFTNFYACIRDVGQVVGVPQDVVIYLRGNPEGRIGFEPRKDTLPILKSQVVVGGSIDRGF